MNHIIQPSLADAKEYKGLVVTPMEKIWDYFEWYQHDDKVCELLGFARSIEERYEHCFPEHGGLPRPDMFSTEDSHLLADQYASCTLSTFYKKDAFLSKLCAYPMREGHGKRFLDKVVKLLRAQKVEHIWLCTDRAGYVNGFYENYGFKLVEEEKGVPPPIWRMRHADHLFCLSLE